MIRPDDLVPLAVCECDSGCDVLALDTTTGLWHHTEPLRNHGEPERWVPTTICPRLRLRYCGLGLEAEERTE